MQIPTSLGDWNLSIIEQLAATGHEGERYDFKRAMPKSPELTKLACAFANTYGGFIIIGVGQSGNKFNCGGVPEDPEIYRNFHNAINCEPEIRAQPPLSIKLGSGNVIYIFEIISSPIKPHLPIIEDQRAFWKRMPSKCVRMSLTEVRYFMNDLEGKREQLALFLIDMHFKLRDLREYWNYNKYRMEFTPHDVSIIDSTMARTYSLTRHNKSFMLFVQEYRNIIVTWNGMKAELPSILGDEFKLSAYGGDQHIRNKLHPLYDRLNFLYGKLSEYLYDEFQVENPYNPITAFGQHRPKHS